VISHTTLQGTTGGEIWFPQKTMKSHKTEAATELR
jgi:hypothetical protein